MTPGEGRGAEQVIYIYVSITPDNRGPRYDSQSTPIPDG
jgi:hypothetical protein